MKEFPADPIIEPHAAGNFLHVGVNLLAEIGYLIDESDLGRKKRIGCIFDQFGSAPVNINDRRRVQVEWPINFGEHAARTLILGADHDAIGMLEIPDRGAFAQELRIRNHLNIGIGPLLA